MQNKGFTLIELMIVVAIIGILSAVAVPVYENYVKKAREAEPLTVVGDLRTAQYAYKEDVTLGAGSYCVNVHDLGWSLASRNGPIGAEPAYYTYFTTHFTTPAQFTIAAICLASDNGSAPDSNVDRNTVLPALGSSCNGLVHHGCFIWDSVSHNLTAAPVTGACPSWPN